MDAGEWMGMIAGGRRLRVWKRLGTSRLWEGPVARGCAAMSMVKSDPRAQSLGTAPVLAQIPRGAPSYGYWMAVSFLVWLTSFSVLIPLYWGFDPGSPRTLDIPAPFRFAILLGFALSPLPLPLHHWIRTRLMGAFGAPARMQQHRGRWSLAADRPLRRGHALVCLLAPLVLLTFAGLMGMSMRWPWVMIVLALEWAAFAADGSLAFRLLREPGCTHVHFRPDGVVLYGTGRAPVRQTPAHLWLTSLVMGAAWVSLASFIVSGRVGEPFFFALLGGSVLATARVYILRQRAVKEQHRRLGKEADEAREMQTSLLPAAPPAPPGVQLAALFQAAHEVSGDFYLFPDAPPGRPALRLVMGDVAGKGLPSALTAALAVGFLRAGAEAAPDPAALLLGAGRSLRAARSGRTMVATCAAELDTTTRRLHWCNAGLPPPALLRRGEVTWLPGGGIPLGSLPQVVYDCHEEQLAPGDLLLFYTDGLVEATSPLGEIFSRERLAAALGRLPAGCSAAQALEHLRTEVARFTGDTEPYDDITAVALRVE